MAAADQRERLAGLTLARGLAALVVVLHHASGHLQRGGMPTGLQSDHGWQFLASLAALPMAFANRFNHPAVLFFIIMSGFCIHLPQVRRWMAPSPQPMRWGIFATKRLVRLLPVLVGAILVTGLLDAVSHRLLSAVPATVAVPSTPQMQAIREGDFRSPIQALGTLVSAQPFWIKPYGSNWPLWLLGYLVPFYVLYPLWYITSKRFGGIAAMAMSLMVMTATVLLLHDKGVAWYPIPRTWWLWCVGALLAEVYVGRIRFPFLLRHAWWLAMIGLAMTVTGLPFLPSPRPAIIDYLLWAGPLGLLTLAFCHTRLGGTNQGRARASLNRLGMLSFSLYVVHMPLLALLSVAWASKVGALPHGPWLVLTGCALSIAVAYPFYVFIERGVATALLHKCMRRDIHH